MIVPIRLSHALNEREHWRARAARAARERTATRVAWLAAGRPSLPEGPVLVTLKRVIGRRGRLVDSDAVPAACKAVRDELAAVWGLPHDRGAEMDRVWWAYAQRRSDDGLWAVEVTWTER